MSATSERTSAPHLRCPPVVKMTWRSNPVTWLVGIALALLALVLLTNLVFGTEVYEGRPATVVLARPAPDSVTVRAAPEETFAATPIQRKLYGRTYRDAWAAPVTVPVLDLGTFAGGLRVEDQGGGFQTLSLDLVDTAGTVYTLRSVAKDPVELMPAFAPYLGIENVVTDGLSAGHPYGSSVAAALAELAGLRHMSPRLYYVPEQPALTTFKPGLGDRLFWLEYEPEGERAPYMGMAGFHEWEDSDDVFEAWREDSLSAKPDLRALIRARLFDFWVGDWDRHDGQWGWAQTKDSVGTSYFYPVPNDRDNVFYGVSGAIPLLVAAFERRLQPFTHEIDDVKGLTKNSAPFDCAFLYGVPEESFVAEAEAFVPLLTDEGIEAAVATWPRSVYALDGPRIVERLKARREDIVPAAREFYRVIQARGPSDRVENEHP